MERIVIVGASLAGLRAAESLRREGYRGELILVGDERHHPYDRPPLSKAFLAGGDGIGTALRRSEALDARWRLGVRAEHLDAGNRSVRLSDGSCLTYDGLVIATGAGPRLLPGMMPCSDGPHVLRTL